MTLGNYARILSNLKDTDKAREINEKALKIGIKHFSEDHE